MRQRLLLVVPGLLVASGAALWLSAWHPVPAFPDPDPASLPVPILTSEEYSARMAGHARPYVFEAGNARGAVLVFGAEHTRDPAAPQLAALRARFAVFRPSAALVEGRLGHLLPWFQDPVRRHGESGLVRALARAAAIPCWTWEPSIEDELRAVLARHPRERVALFYVLRPYGSGLRHGRPADPDAVVEGTRGRRTRWPGLEGALPDLAAVDAAWRRECPGAGDWRDHSDVHGWPGTLAAVFADSNAARDEHFARVLLHLAHRGERVFAVCGSSHAVKLESAVRAALAAAAPGQR